MSTAFSGEIVINAPRQKTWKVVTSADCFSKWVSVFQGDNVHFEGEFSEGNIIRFLDAAGDGVIAKVLEYREAERVEWEFVGVLLKGSENYTDEPETEGWRGLRESFALSGCNGGILLSVMSECPDGYSEYMNKTWPLALEKIKQLAEAA